MLTRRRVWPTNMPDLTTFYHFDAYRIKSLDELREIGFAETVYANGITVIEWGEKARGWLPQNH